MLRTLYRLYRAFSGLRYWAQRRLTRVGWFVASALIATGIMGLDTENSVASQGFTLLLFVLLVAVPFSWFFRARFSASRLLPRFGTVGHPLEYTVLVRNESSKTQNDLTLLEELSDPRPSFAQWRAVKRAYAKELRTFRVSWGWRRSSFRPATLGQAPVPPMLPNEESEVQLQLTPLRRGVLRFSGLALARPDPFGLFQALSKVSLPQSTLILPRRYPLPPILFPGAMRYQQGGVALASRVGQSEEFVALRDYRPGDPLRHIHWRSWAKAGKPVVREFEDEFFVRHALVLDTFTENPQSEIFEEAVSVAASFACTIQTQESLLDLLLVGEQAYCFTSGRGLAHGDQMLEILASVQPCSKLSFQTLERLVLNHARGVSACICVLVAWDETRQNFVEKLRASEVPVLVLVIVPAGQGKRMGSGAEWLHVLELGHVKAGLSKLK